MSREKLAIVIEVDSKSGEARLREVDKELSRLDGTAKSAANSLGTVAGALVSGIASKEAVDKLIDVGRRFDVINASLETVTGSASKAQAAFNRIKDFAATTPYQLGQVADAFVKLSALGLDPSERALISYGNTAAAMGKSLNQMIEAVADASTFEFERLKEFGIKARQQGDSVQFTFRGITTEVAKDSQAIQEYLLKIGETDFAGAMERRAKSLDGALSNLADSWDNLWLTISQSGVSNAIADLARYFAQAADGASTFINVITGNESDQLAVAKRLADLRAELANLKRLADSYENATWYEKGLAKIITFGMADTDPDSLRAKMAEVRAEIEKLEKTRAKLIKQSVEPSAAPTSPAATGTHGTSPAVNKAAEEARKVIDIHSAKWKAIQIMADAAYTDEETRLLAAQDAKFVALDEERQRMLEALRVQITDKEALKQAEADLNAYYDDLKVQQAQQTAERLYQIEKADAERRIQIEKQAKEARLSLASGAMGALANILATGGRKAFEASKALAIAETVISTYSAAQKAYESQLSIPTPDAPARAAVAAGIAIAQGMARVAAIASQSYGGATASAGAGGAATPGGIATQQGYTQPVAPAPQVQQAAPQVHITVQALHPENISPEVTQRIADSLAPALHDTLARGGQNVAVMA